jgi:hypothetical protein
LGRSATTKKKCNKEYYSAFNCNIPRTLSLYTVPKYLRKTLLTLVESRWWNQVPNSINHALIVTSSTLHRIFGVQGFAAHFGQSLLVPFIIELTAGHINHDTKLLQGLSQQNTETSFY